MVPKIVSFVDTGRAPRDVLLSHLICRGYYLEAVKEHIQVLSQLLINNVTHDSDTIMATGKLLLLMATAVNEKPRKHHRSLTERINIARNLLNCYFELIKSEGKNNNYWSEKFRKSNNNLFLCTCRPCCNGSLEILKLNFWITSFQEFYLCILLKIS